MLSVLRLRRVAMYGDRQLLLDRWRLGRLCLRLHDDDRR